MDNLNTHKPSSLYKRYPAVEACRIIKRLEIHYPQHGSWLDIAEIELNVITRQCLSRRIYNISKLQEELYAWEWERNSMVAKVNWQFRTADPRIKYTVDRLLINNATCIYSTNKRQTRFFTTILFGKSLSLESDS